MMFMYKILSFGRSCKAYLQIFKDTGPDVTLYCESCGHRLHKHGRYYRYVAGKTEYLCIPIYRWLCPKCGTTVSLLPDFLVPWARCATWIREGAIRRKHLGQSFRRIAETVISPRIGLSPRTIKRWWRQQLARAADASLWLAGELVRLRCEADLLRMFPNPVSPDPANVCIASKGLLGVPERKDAEESIPLSLAAYARHPNAERQSPLQKQPNKSDSPLLGTNPTIFVRSSSPE